MKIFDTRIEMINALLSPGYVGAEIGVLNGDFADELFKLNPSMLHLVDLWQIWGESTSSADVDGNDPRMWNLDDCYKNVFKKYGTATNVSIKKQQSVEFLNECPDEYFDFVYIDTTHQYLHTLDELKAAWPKIKPGGYISGHDFDLTDRCKNNWKHEVDHAVYEFCTKYRKKISALACDGCMSFAIQK